MKIKEFVKTLDRNTVYYIHFNLGDWGIIFNNILFLDDGSYDILDECSYLEDEDIIYDGSSAECFKFCAENNQIYPNTPMPELKVGMFIEAKGKLGVIVNDITIAYQDGTWSNLDEVIITKIFTKNAICFKLCTDKYIMWRRD